ncbi:MAG: hypothetical protein GF368_00955 [Candidatus Aenigmarchaeota archaeon]|nr:hypothetical protein [Candidatus Aenigmarchaeota archaeon]
MRELIVFSSILLPVIVLSGCTQEVAVDKFYCESDNDCVHLPSACHQGSNLCVNGVYASKIDLPDGPIACTEECRSCTECFCENNVCKTITSDPPGCC